VTDEEDMFRFHFRRFFSGWKKMRFYLGEKEDATLRRFPGIFYTIFCSKDEKMGEKNSSLGLSSFPPYYFLRRRKILNH
jgi:hypothetical protein